MAVSGDNSLNFEQEPLAGIHHDVPVNPASTKQTNRVAKKFRISKKYFEGKKLT
jgi:hypothetical protein